MSNEFIPHRSSLIAHHSSLITHPSSLIPHHSSLITHPSSLIPHHSSLITHPSSLIPHHSLTTHSPLITHYSLTTHHESLVTLQSLQVALPEQLGPYRISAMLGEGGMGAVYRAQDTRLGRDVAIKVLTAVTLSDQEKLQRFEQEARTTGMLNH